jgi:hypothetical protein
LTRRPTGSEHAAAVGIGPRVVASLPGSHRGPALLRNTPSRPALLGRAVVRLNHCGLLDPTPVTPPESRSRWRGPRLRNYPPAEDHLRRVRASGVRGLLIYCSDYKCSHSTMVSGNKWPTKASACDRTSRRWPGRASGPRQYVRELGRAQTRRSPPEALRAAALVMTTCPKEDSPSDRNAAPTLPDTLDEVQQLACRSAEPVQFCDQHHVAGLDMSW